MKPDTDHLVKTIKQDEQIPAVQVGKIEQLTNAVSSPVTTEFKFDKNAVLYLIYLLYKCNVLARNNLNQMINEVGKPVPPNVTEWLVKESMR